MGFLHTNQSLHLCSLEPPSGWEAGRAAEDVADDEGIVGGQAERKGGGVEDQEQEVGGVVGNEGIEAGRVGVEAEVAMGSAARVGPGQGEAAGLRAVEAS